MRNIAKTVISVFVAVILLLMAVGFISPGSHNFFAETGLLAPSSPSVSGIVLPFTGGMKLGVFNLLHIVGISWVISAVMYWAAHYTFPWQEPTKMSAGDIEAVEAFKGDVPSDLKNRRSEKPQPEKSEAPETPEQKPEESPEKSEPKDGE